MPTAKRRAPQPAKRLAGLRKNLFGSPQPRRTPNKRTEPDAPPPAHSAPFPDISDSSAIQRAYRLPELRTMLDDVGLDSSGTKDALAQRLAQHAQSPILASRGDNPPSFTDIQALFVLQQRRLPIDADPAVRRSVVESLIHAPVNSLSDDESPPPLPAPNSAATLPPALSLSQSQLPSSVEREVQDLRAAVQALQQSL
jgi:hypothetical protein